MSGNQCAALLLLPAESHGAVGVPKHQASLLERSVAERSADALAEVCSRVLFAACEGSTASRNSAILEAIRELKRVGQFPEFLLVHDVMYPLISTSVIDGLFEAARNGFVVASAVIEPLQSFLGRRPGEDAGATPYFHTPQVIRFSKLSSALESAENTPEWSCLDHIELLEAQGECSILCLPSPSVFGLPAERWNLACWEGVLKFGHYFQTELGCVSSLQGERVLLLGGSGGIGNACLKALREEGIEVAAPSRFEIDLENPGFSLPLKNSSILIHSAGNYSTCAERVMQVNFFSALRILDLAKDSAWQGKILFLSSSSATFGRPDLPVYSASKAALNALIEARARELSKLGILLNAVAPGKVDTRMQRLLNPDTPQNFLLTPSQVADLILGLLATNCFGRILYLRKGIETT